MNKFKDKFLNYGVLVLIFFTPIVYFSNRIIPHITSHTFFFYGFANLLFGFWLYCLFTDKSYRLDKKQLFIFIPLLLYIVWMSISGILAVNPHLAFWSSLMRGTGLITLYYCTGLALIIASLVKKNGILYFYSILKFFTLSSFIVAISVWLGNEGFNIQKDVFVRSSGGGLLGNSSITAAYLIFGFFIGFFLLISENINKKWKYIIVIIMATIIFSPLFINIHGLLTGKSILGSARGALLGIFIGVGFLSLLYFSFSKKKIIKIFGIVSIIISLFVFIFGWMSFVKPGTYLHEKFVQSASGTRFIFWDIAQKSMDEHPYFGYGPENYMIAFQDNFNPIILNKEYGHEGSTDRAHNIYFDTGVSGGYPAILFYITFLLSIFYGIYNAFKYEKISRLQAGILGGMLVGYVFQNLFVFDSLLSIISLFIVVGVSFGLFTNEKKEEIAINNKNKINKDKQGALKILLGLSLVILFGTSWYYFSISPARKVKLFGTVISMTVDKRASNYNKLLEGSAVGNDWDVGGFAHNNYQLYAKNAASIKLDKKNLPFYEKDLLANIDYLEKVYLNNKNDYRLTIGMVHLYSTYIYLTDKGNDQVISTRMLELLQHAHDISPTNPESYWGMAQVYAWRGDFKSIIDIYKKAIELDRKVPASHILLIKFAKNIGDIKLYNESLLQAQNDIPGFILGDE